MAPSRSRFRVPPALARVGELMTDLVAYLNRDDVPVMVQAAIGHSEFESIYAFTDGNGNGHIGRAMVSAVLRRRGVTKTLLCRWPVVSWSAGRTTSHRSARTAAATLRRL